MLDTFLDLVLSCCRKRPRPTDEPDERTHLIRPTEDVLPTVNPVIDHQKLRERLGVIVRSKEGKMVNVNATLPFNLHSRTLLEAETSSSRSAKSVSGQRSPAADSGDHVVVDLSEDVGEASEQPFDSQDDLRSLQTSRSTTSLQPGDASYLPPEADPQNGHRRPILNARIVRGVDGGFNVGGGRVGRSRTRGRAGRFEDDVGQMQASASRPGINTTEGPHFADVGSLTLSSPTSGDGEASLGSELATPKAKAPQFKFTDAAKIARSWGD